MGVACMKEDPDPGPKSMALHEPTDDTTHVAKTSDNMDGETRSVAKTSENTNGETRNIARTRKTADLEATSSATASGVAKTSESAEGETRNITKTKTGDLEASNTATTSNVAKTSDNKEGETRNVAKTRTNADLDTPKAATISNVAKTSDSVNIDGSNPAKTSNKSSEAPQVSSPRRALGGADGRGDKASTTTTRNTVTATGSDGLSVAGAGKDSAASNDNIDLAATNGNREPVATNGNQGAAVINGNRELEGASGKQEPAVINRSREQGANDNQDPAVATGNQEPEGANDNQEPTLANGNPDPAVTNGDQDPAVISDSQEPGANGNQESSVTNGNQEPAVTTSSPEQEVTNGNQEPAATNGSQGATNNNHERGTTNGNHEPGTAGGNQEPIAANGSQEPVAANGSQEPAVANTQQQGTHTRRDEAKGNTTSEDTDSESEDDDEDEEDDDEEARQREDKRREEEESKVVWLRKVEDREGYVRSMAPQYFLLAVTSDAPLQEESTGVRMAVTHLAKKWPWLGLRLRLRGKDRVPWVCTEPEQPVHFQVAYSEDNARVVMEEVQLRHRNFRGCPLSTFTLVEDVNRDTADTTPATDSDVDTSSPTDPDVNISVTGGDTNTSAAGGDTNTSAAGGDTNTSAAGGDTNTSAAGGDTNTASVIGGDTNIPSATGSVTNTASATNGNINASSAIGDVTNASSATGGVTNTAQTTSGVTNTAQTTSDVTHITPATGGVTNIAPANSGVTNTTPATGDVTNIAPATSQGATATGDDTNTSASDCDGTSSSGGSSTVKPAFPHKYQLLVSIPQPFADEAMVVEICDTLVKFTDDVIGKRITTKYEQELPASDTESNTQKNIYEEQLELLDSSRCDSRASDNNASVLTGGYDGEENEDENNGYIERTVDALISKNFLNKCKAERVSYISGFTTCVSAAATNLVLEAGDGPQSGQVDVNHRLNVHYNWPEPPYEWHDKDGEEEDDEDDLSSGRPIITITASPKEWKDNFWRTARSVHTKQWEMPKPRRSAAPKILQGLESESEEEYEPPPRYPDVHLSISDITVRDSGEFCRCGEHVRATSLHRVSLLRHLLLTHSIDLHIREECQSLRFNLSHSTLFLPTATGRRFADEIESVVRSSLKFR